MWRQVLLLRIVLPAASGGLLALAFPSPELSACAWIALVPLLWAIDGARPGPAAGSGWVFGFAFALGTLYWVVNPINHYTEAPAVVAGVALVALAAAIGAYMAGFALAVRLVARSGIGVSVVAPVAWVAVEWLRSSGPVAFPWVALGYSQYLRHGLVQSAEVTGVYGISAVVVLANAVVFELLRDIRTGRGRRLAVVLAVAALVGGLSVAGQRRIQAVTGSARRGGLDVGVVQANIDQGEKWEAEFQLAAVGRHAELARQVRRDGAELVVWPETAVPFYFQSPSAPRDLITDLARAEGFDLVFGSPAYRGGGRDLSLFNRAYLVRRDGTVGGYYDKLRLVPFGEYVPFQSLLFFVDKMVEGVGHFVPGSEATVFQVPAGRFGVLICYEGIFPSLSRALVAGGAEFLINITNDAWFGRTSAPHQHLAMVTLRAVENRVPIVRAANTGVSAIVDIDGRIRWRTPLFEEAARIDTVAWPGIQTFYTRHGDVFAGGCGLASALLIGYAGVRRWRGRPGRPVHRG
jgi:apolipoprotein N-acyltransferase